MDDVKYTGLRDALKHRIDLCGDGAVQDSWQAFVTLVDADRASSGRPTEAAGNDRLAGIVERMSVVDMDDAGPSKVMALDHATLSDPDGKAIVLTNEDFWLLHAASSERAPDVDAMSPEERREYDKTLPTAADVRGILKGYERSSGRPTEAMTDEEMERLCEIIREASYHRCELGMEKRPLDDDKVRSIANRVAIDFIEGVEANEDAARLDWLEEHQSDFFSGEWNPAEKWIVVELYTDERNIVGSGLTLRAAIDAGRAAHVPESKEGTDAS